MFVLVQPRKAIAFVPTMAFIMMMGCAAEVGREIDQDKSVEVTAQESALRWRWRRRDAGRGLRDAGSLIRDSATTSADAGAVPQDTGATRSDAGPVVRDSGPPVSTDAGPRDSGTPLPSSYRGDIALRVTSVASNAISLSWPTVAGARAARVIWGADPSTATDGRLPGATVTETVASSATTYTLQNVAAATHAFVRVEVDSSDGVTHWGNTHAQTNGGQFATLNNALREVHAFGQSTLMLVVTDANAHYIEASHAMTGDNGSAWQTGTWQVTRANGRAVSVVAVRRQSAPIGQNNYPVGYMIYGDGAYVDIDHSIFLVLNETIGSHEVLTITHTGTAATALTTRVPFSDRYLETPLIQVNQVGYNPRASKRWAYVSGLMGDGGGVNLVDLPLTAEVLSEPTDPLSVRPTVLGSLAVATRSTSDTESGTLVSQIDLAALPASESARYRVRLPGIGVSWRTAVSEKAALRAFYTTTRGLYHNRWCGDLGSAYTEWSRPADHCAAYFVSGSHYQDIEFFPASTSLADRRPLIGGHHDAGDFDIRPFHVLVAQYLMRGYETSPTHFTDQQLTVPESGNGIPDLLDEALWSVAAWQALQNPDGSVRAGVESWRNAAGIHFANDDGLTYWTFEPEPWHTAYVAALFAQAARLVKPFNAAKSSALETAARRAFSSPIAASAPNAYRLYAASELYALTGEATYKTTFETLWHTIDKYGRGAFDNVNTMINIYPGAFVEYAPVMADFVMGYVNRAGADATIVSVTRAQIEERADEAAAAILESPYAHRNGKPTGDAHDWGHLTATGRFADMIYEALQLGGYSVAKMQRYFDAASVSGDYALGCNPMGVSYTTGLGSRSPHQPLHLDSLAGQKARGMPPVPGIPVYGPVNDLSHVYYYDPIRYATYPIIDVLPAGRRYIDSYAAVTTSEFTVWETSAPMTELFSALLGSGQVPPTSWKPGGSEHRATLP